MLMKEEYIDPTLPENRMIIRRHIYFGVFGSEHFKPEQLTPVSAATFLIHPQGRIISPDFEVEDRIYRASFSEPEIREYLAIPFELCLWDGIPRETMMVDIFQLDSVDGYAVRFLTDPNESSREQSDCLSRYLSRDEEDSLEAAVERFEQVKEEFFEKNRDDPLASSVEGFEKNLQIRPLFICNEFDWDYTESFPAERLPCLSKDYRGHDPYIPPGWHPVDEIVEPTRLLDCVLPGRTSPGAVQVIFMSKGESGGKIVKFQRTFVIHANGEFVAPRYTHEDEGSDATEYIDIWELEIDPHDLIIEILNTKFGEAYKYQLIPRRITIKQALKQMDLLNEHGIDMAKTTPIDCTKVYSKVQQTRGK